MEYKNIDANDRAIRQAIEMTKKKAPDNLKHRVMHQIMQEEALKKKYQISNKKSINLLKDFFGIYGVMYAVLILILLGSHFTKGKYFILSSQFMYPVFFICFVFAAFWLIVTIDSRRKQR